MKKITIYSTMTCPYCANAKMLLTDKGQSYEEIDVGRNPDQRAVMIKRASGGYTVPQIFIGDKHVGGFDDLYALENAGKLDALLA